MLPPYLAPSQDKAASTILSRTIDGKQFVVAYKDTGYEDVGLVDARAAKLQRTNGDDPSCPLSLDVSHALCWQKALLQCIC